MTGVRIDVLGPLHVRHDDVLLPVTGLKNRTVIACLALHPEQPVDVDTLLKAAWGEPPPRSAVHQVRKMISAFRLSLDAGWGLVSTSQQGYLLRVTAEHSDLAEFSRRYAKAMSGTLATDDDLASAYAALALWRGKPSEGSEPRGLEGRIAELLEQHRALLLKTLRAFSERGREDELIAVLQIAARIHGGSMQNGTGEEGGPPPADHRVPRPRPSWEVEQPPVTPEVPGGGRCLPPDLRDFSGRAGEIGRLEEFLHSQRSGPSVATIHGMGGVGKTALAVHVAQLVAPAFPDGQLFVNLDESSSPGAQTVRNTLGSLLRQMGTDDDIPMSEESRLARWRHLTAGRAVLIVLDDAASVAQVEPLLPASSRSACIVTSRAALGGIDGALYLRLEVPTDDECVAMLRSIVGEPVLDDDLDAARRLIRRFENLPLALRLAAARLATREYLSFHDLTQSLADSPCPFDDLDEVPGRSLLGRLNASLQTMESFDLDRYLRLSLLPAPELDETAVSVALGVSTDQARRTCRRFTDRALLQRIGTGAYKMHSLLAQAAGLHLQAGVPIEEQRRVVAAALEYYADSVGLVGSARVNPSPGPTPGLLFATLTRAAESAGRLGLQEAFADLCLAWERPVSLYLDTDQQQVVWDLALRAARDHPSASARGNILLALSRCFWHRNLIAEGTDSAKQAWEEAERADDYLLRVRSLVRSSSFCWLSHDVPGGLRYLEQAKAFLGPCRCQVGEVVTRREALEIASNEAALLVQDGDFVTAARLSKLVMDASDGDPRVTIMARVTYAASQLGLNKHGEALAAAAAALQEATQVRSAYGRALALQQTTDTLRSLARPGAANAAAEQAREAARETGSVRLVEELSAFLDGAST